MGIENVFKANHNIIPPSITSPVRMFTDEYTVELKNYRDDGKIFYTIDGSDPSEISTQYIRPFKITETTTIKAFTKWNDSQSRSISYVIEKKNPAEK
jgi:N-acetyl-beta-hexosaminidase